MVATPSGQPPPEAGLLVVPKGPYADSLSGTQCLIWKRKHLQRLHEFLFHCFGNEAVFLLAVAVGKATSGGYDDKESYTAKLHKS
ncbi:hypothetical protein H5410_047184 [Solanum commersonii]|uniref:Uncharacterized protein n=1 Tax=Solanum commersonii TaxID=4109 RepID=A0A9J5XHW9_SOLCO|nr:hypothetical protein H5410_047184 [Solanum commersonii]